MAAPSSTDPPPPAKPTSPALKRTSLPPSPGLGAGVLPPGSYVYPVKSLLAGIQPAEDVAADVPGLVGVIGSPPSKDSLSYIASKIKKQKPSGRKSAGASPVDTEFEHDLSLTASSSTFTMSSSKSFGSYFPQVSASDTAASSSRAAPSTRLDPSLQQQTKDRIRESMESQINANVGLTRSKMSLQPDSAAYIDDPDESTDRKPPGHFNIANKGYVHLAPAHSPAAGSQASSHTSSLHTRSLISRASASGNSSGLSLEASQEGSNNTSDVELVTARYEHMQDEHGYHVVVGRKGTLTKCEDEPIHAPGAVQGFGVLIAVEDSEETGNLVVRQVSENAYELLGLSPQYLFGLDCFTQTLPDTQADLLWDNVQFLHGSESETDGGLEYAPQVFLLSGWGEPGSVTSEDDLPAFQSDRKIWTCWCAAHRPPLKPLFKDGAVNPGRHPNVIILEFELERDIYNPLYPPFSQDEKISGGSSPNSASGSSWGSQTTGTGSSRDGDLSASNSGSSRSTPSTGGNSSTGNATTTQAKENQKAAAAAANLAGGRSPIDMDENIMLNPAEFFLSSKEGLEGDESWFPTPEDLFESTTSRSKPLKALERMRRVRRDPASETGIVQQNAARTNLRRQAARARRGTAGGGVGTMDIFAVLAQVTDQLSSSPDLDSFLKIVVGVIKDLTQFHRVLVYQFDEQWNGQAVAELVDWKQTHDLYKGLHFPASDIPAQARELYRINKVRLLYDRSQTTARLVVRTKADLETPLDLTHSYLRAMSPIHIKYLGNMGVRSSMSISIVTFGALWGLITCHAYGLHGMRVSFPVRQMLRLLSDSISRNVERLSYARRLHTRKLISTLPTDAHPTGYIVSNAEDLLGLFDADFGVLVIGEGAKIFGPNQRGQEILLVAEYLRLKQFNLMQVSQSLAADFPDLQLPSGLDVIAGLLYVPLSHGGKDFICFLRKGQVRDVHWAGKPYKDGDGSNSVLEPRKSFKAWSERVAGRCRAWTDEQMETAGVLALVYGKFIEVWRQKEYALQTTQMTNLLLSNASHEVRTPLNHIINYLELALNGPLDAETRDNLVRSHLASKGLLFTINDLLDLTKLETGKETSFNDNFDLHASLEEAVHLYKTEAARRNLFFELDLADSPKWVIGDSKKIRTVVSNLTGNAVKYTVNGSVRVTCRQFKEPTGLRDKNQIAVEIIVSDTGCGIENAKLEAIFREFEQVDSSMPKPDTLPGLGLGLAVVARIVEQLGGQLRVDSKQNEGSRFTFLVPFTLGEGAYSPRHSRAASAQSSPGAVSGTSVIDSLVESLSRNHMEDHVNPSNNVSSPGGAVSKPVPQPTHPPQNGKFEVTDSRFPIRSVRLNEGDIDHESVQAPVLAKPETPPPTNLRVLIVEDDKINRTILGKRLKLDGHEVVYTENGQEAVEKVESDQEFDCILMDLQMPILNGFEATERIRALEKSLKAIPSDRISQYVNGRIPIFAVSASLSEKQYNQLMETGMDGWILKPIDFKRSRKILEGIYDVVQREQLLYHPGCNWEAGGWLTRPQNRVRTSNPASPS